MDLFALPDSAVFAAVYAMAIDDVLFVGQYTHKDGDVMRTEVLTRVDARAAIDAQLAPPVTEVEQVEQLRAGWGMGNEAADAARMAGP